MNVFNFIRDNFTLDNFTDNFTLDNFIIDNFIDTFFFGESDLFYPGSFIEPPTTEQNREVREPEEDRQVREEPEQFDFIKSGNVSEDSEDWDWGEVLEV